ncbi:PilZ domain-containing protein [Acetobacter syzygii]|nr:PilZ domain-containing protein [Acetobacter syzygii]NSL93190.1 PilZ domain-containing protein [Acetobacter syzygii]
MNLLWVLANLLIVLAAITVGYERKQNRRAPRIPAQLAVSVTDPLRQKCYAATTVDLSKGGASLRMSEPLPADLEVVNVEYSNPHDKITMNVPAQIINQQGTFVRLEWRNRTIQDETSIVEMIFGRSDAWSHWSDYSKDKPLHSLNLLARGIINFMLIVVLRRRPIG